DHASHAKQNLIDVGDDVEQVADLLRRLGNGDGSVAAKRIKDLRKHSCGVRAAAGKRAQVDARDQPIRIDQIVSSGDRNGSVFRLSTIVRMNDPRTGEIGEQRAVVRCAGGFENAHNGIGKV